MSLNSRGKKGFHCINVHHTKIWNVNMSIAHFLRFQANLHLCMGFPLSTCFTDDFVCPCKIPPIFCAIMHMLHRRFGLPLQDSTDILCHYAHASQTVWVAFARFHWYSLPLCTCCTDGFGCPFKTPPIFCAIMYMLHRRVWLPFQDSTDILCHYAKLTQLCYCTLWREFGHFLIVVVPDLCLY